MRLRWGLPEPTEDFERLATFERLGWVKLKSPSQMQFMLYSVPILFLLGALYISFARLFSPDWKAWSANLHIPDSDMNAILAVCVLLFSMVVVSYIHELLHALCLPAPYSDKIVVGTNGIVGFTFTEQAMSKARYLLVLVMPCLVSFLAIWLLGIMHFINIFSLFLCLVNGVGGAADVAMFIFFSLKVPRHAEMRYLHLFGGNVYYRVASPEANRRR